MAGEAVEGERGVSFSVSFTRCFSRQVLDLVDFFDGGLLVAMGLAGGGGTSGSTGGVTGFPGFDGASTPFTASRYDLWDFGLKGQCLSSWPKYSQYGQMSWWTQVIGRKGLTEPSGALIGM